MTTKTADEPQSERSVVTADGQEGGVSLEDDCLHLLARLEQLLARLEEAKKSGRTTALLGRAKEMMVELLDFAEPRFDERTLDAPLQRTREVYQAVKQFEQHSGNQSLGGIGRLFGVDHAQKGEFDDEAYRQLGVDLAGLYRQFFALFAGQFDDETAAQRWQSCSLALVGEFQQKW